MKAGKILMKLVDYLIMDCISYTVVSFILAVLSAVNIVQNMDYHILLQLIFCTTIISLLMFVENLLFPDSIRKELLVGLVNGLLVTFILGGALFHWFPWKQQYVAMVLLIFAVSYLIAYGIKLLDNKRLSDKINVIIKEKRK